MFTKLLSKGLKNIAIDSKKSHIYLKETDFSLVIIRPYDLVQLGDLVGSGSEDILVWAGKTIGKALLKNIQEKKKLKTRRKLFEELVTNLNTMGYGKFQLDYVEGKKVKIDVSDSIIKEVKEKDDAQLICNLYNGIFMGSFNAAGADVEVKQVKCTFDSDSPMVFEYEFTSEGEEEKD